MEINKQLFEDVFSGKLKGTFVLRDGSKIPLNKLRYNCGGISGIDPPLILNQHSYIYTGICFDTLFSLDIIDFIVDEIDPEMYSYNEKDIQFMEHFINDHHMKENELTIEIPDGKIVDWDESKKQNKIVLKDKQLTYKDVCEKLFENKYRFYTSENGDINSIPLHYANNCICHKNNATTAHQLECLLAKNQLANVAVYLNNGWKPDKCSDIYYINNYHGNLVVYLTKEECSMCLGQSIFKTEELAQQAIEILGEKTVKLALEQLGI